MVDQGQHKVELHHDGLNKSRIVRGYDPNLVLRKAELQIWKWEEEWNRRQREKKKWDYSILHAREDDEKQQFAESYTKKAEEGLKQIEETLIRSIKEPLEAQWEQMVVDDYPVSQPSAPNIISLPKSPKERESLFAPNLTFWDYIVPGRKTQKMKEATKAYSARLDQVNQENTQAKEKHEAALRTWEEGEAKFKAHKAKRNQAVLAMKEKYRNNASQAIIEFCELLLLNSKYPDTFPNDYFVDYYPDSKILLVEYALPLKEHIPTLKKIAFNSVMGGITEETLPNIKHNALYDELGFKICLRVIHELFEADRIDAIDSIVFNGCVQQQDNTTGQESSICIMSVHAQRSELMSMNMVDASPKACFKRLGGETSGALHLYSPVDPFLIADKGHEKPLAVEYKHKDPKKAQEGEAES